MTEFPPAFDSSERQRRCIVEIRAGKMSINGKLVTADKRRGKMCLLNGADGLLHFQWLSRETGGIEDDLILINDAYLERVSEAKTGRVYVLRFTSSNKKLLFWFQEPDEEVDDELVALFNKHAGGKPSSSTNGTSSSSSSSTVTGTSSSSSNTVALPSASSSSSGTLSSSSSSSSSSSGGTSGGVASLFPPISSRASARLGNGVVPLSSILTQPHLLSLLDDDVAVKELLKFMPPGQDESRRDLEEVLRSSQFETAITCLSEAIYSDQLPVILSSLNITPAQSLPSSSDPLRSSLSSSSPHGDNMEIFLSALEHAAAVEEEDSGDVSDVSMRSD